MIPKDSREAMPIDFQDSAHFESSFPSDICPISLNVSSTIVFGINDIRNLADENITTPSAILYLYCLPQPHSPVNHLLYRHPLRHHGKYYTNLVVGKAYRH